MLAQVVTPDVLRIIDQGGSKAVIAVLAIVVVYLARENAKLNVTLHERDEKHATKLHDAHVASAAATLALQTAHAAAMAGVTEERINDLETLAKAAAALESIGRRMDVAPARRAPR